jgi:hypothetical protein
MFMVNLLADLDKEEGDSIHEKDVDTASTMVEDHPFVAGVDVHVDTAFAMIEEHPSGDGADVHMHADALDQDHAHDAVVEVDYGYMPLVDINDVSCESGNTCHDVFEESDVLRMFWIDSFEKSGVVYLFGKVSIVRDCRTHELALP